MTTKPIDESLMWTPDVCIYHANCHDGFGAAWVINDKWPEGVTYYPCSYGDEPPLDIANKNVLIVDFSFNEKTLLAMSESAKSIVVLDHHVSAEKALGNMPSIKIEKLTAWDAGDYFRNYEKKQRMLPPILAHFDMTKSGVRLAFEFCYAYASEDSFSPFLAAIEDRDLWLWNLKHTEEIHMFLRSIPMTFEDWDEAINLHDDMHGRFIVRARQVVSFNKLRVAEIAKEHMVQEFGGFEGVPCCVTPYAFVSEVGHLLLDEHPDAPFVALFVFQANRSVAISLRSTHNREDVSAIATRFGGGGHRNAAGFATKDLVVLGKTLDV